MLRPSDNFPASCSSIVQSPMKLAAVQKNLQFRYGNAEARSPAPGPRYPPGEAVSDTIGKHAAAATGSRRRPAAIGPGAFEFEASGSRRFFAPQGLAKRRAGRNWFRPSRFPRGDFVSALGIRRAIKADVVLILTSLDSFLLIYPRNWRGLIKSRVILKICCDISQQRGLS